MSFSFTVKHEDELFEITNKLAPTLKNQKIIFIEGGVVGAGKTTFIRYLLETLAKKQPIKILFFKEVQPIKEKNQYYFNQLNCVHFDFYQVEDSLGIDLEDYIIDHCLFIEWLFFEFFKKDTNKKLCLLKLRLKIIIGLLKMYSENLQWLHQIQ